jgi:hypothetical protein
MPCLHPNTFFLKFDFNVSQFHKIYHFRKYVTIHRVETKFLKKKKKKKEKEKEKRAHLQSAQHWDWGVDPVGLVVKKVTAISVDS